MQKYKTFKDKYLRAVFVIGFFIFLATAVFSAVKFWSVPGSLIIHFDAFKGIDWVGNRNDILGIFISVLAMGIINFSLTEFIYERERFVAYLLAFANLVLSILFLTVVISIVSANF